MVKYYNKINSLNKRLELQKPIKETDGVGGYNITWEKVKNVWGSIDLISNISNSNYSMLEIKATHLIVVRYLNNINIGMRFLHNNKIFNIKYINNIDKNFTEIICESREEQQ